MYAKEKISCCSCCYSLRSKRSKRFRASSSRTVGIRRAQKKKECRLETLAPQANAVQNADLSF